LTRRSVFTRAAAVGRVGRWVGHGDK
jgi:hypothetical protein